MATDGVPVGEEDDLPGADITVTRVDHGFRRCSVEVDGHVLGALRPRGPGSGVGSGVGINFAGGRHTLRALGGRLTSAVLELDLLPGQAVTVTIDRGPKRHQRWTLTTQPPS